MSKLKKFILVFALLSIVIIPLSASAALVTLVTCAAGQCTYCDLLDMGQDILNFIKNYVLIAGAVVFIMIGGFRIITAGGNPGAYKKGWDTIKATLIGITIAFSAWFIVNTIVNILAVSSGQSMDSIFWDKITCEDIKPQ